MAKLMKCWDDKDTTKRHDKIRESWKGNQLKKQFGIEGMELENVEEDELNDTWDDD